MNNESLNETESEEEKRKIDQKRTKMLTKPVRGLVCEMAVPTIISMLVTAFYNLVDTFFVGRIGTNSATGAVGVVFSYMTIVQAIGFFFGHGSGNFISRAIGKKDYDSAAKMAATGFYSCLAFGVILSVVGLFLRRPLALIFGATPTMLEDTQAYLTYILIGTPYMMSAFVLNNQLRFQGNSFFAMVGLVAGGVLNIALDPLLIFTFKMGISGAALATIISQLVSFIMLFVGCQKSSNVTIKIRNITLSTDYFKEIAVGGFPSLCRQGLASVSTLVLNHLAGNYGDAAIAAFTVVTKITNIAGSAMIGFGQGFQPVCGFNYGAKEYGRVKKAVWFSVEVSTVFLTVISIVIYAFSEQLVSFFRNDPEVIEIGSAAMRYECFAVPLLGWIIMMNMFLQTTRKVVPASVLAMARQGIVLIPVLYVLTHFFGIVGLELAQPVADVISFIIAIPLGARALKELNG